MTRRAAKAEQRCGVIQRARRPTARSAHGRQGWRRAIKERRSRGSACARRRRVARGSRRGGGKCSNRAWRDDAGRRSAVRPDRRTRRRARSTRSAVRDQGTTCSRLGARSPSSCRLEEPARRWAVSSGRAGRDDVGRRSAAVPEMTCSFYPNNPNNPSKMAIIRPKTAESRGSLAQISEFQHGNFGFFLVQLIATRPCRFGGHFGVINFCSCSCCSRRTTLSLVVARPRGRSRTGVEMTCSPAVADGTCEAACACLITRVRHSSANSEVVSGTARRRGQHGARGARRSDERRARANCMAGGARGRNDALAAQRSLVVVVGARRAGAAMGREQQRSWT